MVKHIAGLTVVLSALLAAGPALASGPEEVAPWGLDENGGPPAEQAAFYDGTVGVLMGQSPWARLFGAWRLLHTLPVGHEIGASLAVTCCEEPAQRVTDAVNAWQTARQQIDGVAAISYLETDREVGDLYGVPNCFADAFDTAVKTLADRIAQHGKTDRWVRAWLDGQDVVFGSCHDDVALPALPADAPDWLKQDRAYQAAARTLYRREFDAAAAQFKAIGADAASPWQKLGPYLALRAEIHSAIHAQNRELYAKAMNDIAEIVANDYYGWEASLKYAGMLNFRLAPDQRRTWLAENLGAATLPATAAVDFKDLRRLGQSPAGTPEFLDWIAVFGRDPDDHQNHFRDEPDLAWKTDAEARTHALDRWRQGKDSAWLLAALAATAQGDKEAGELVEAARAIEPDAPAYLTAAFHRIRLTTAAGDPAALRQELDKILERPDLSATTRNLFLGERIQLAENLDRFAALALRKSGCPAAAPDDATCDTGYRDPQKTVDLGLDAETLIDRMALDTRSALAHLPALDAGFRLDIALTGFVRAVLAQDDATSDRLAADLKTLLPPLAAEWQGFLDAKPGDDKRFAGYYILAKIPGANPDLSNSDYTRPEGKIAEFQGHWHDWQFYPAGHPAPDAAAKQEDPDPVCQSLCGAAGFPLRSPDFIAAGASQATKERARFAPDGADKPGMADVWEAVLAYATAHPKDPRAPETLYWLVRISRFGTGHNHSSHRAYDLLKARYPASEWAKKTKYYYD